MKVLVVDDVRFMRYYLNRMLTQHGFDVVTAASGEEALERLEQESAIDVVITDLIMPGMDGFELLQTARKVIPQNRKLPVFVLMTALLANADAHYKDLPLLPRAASLGFASVFSKPFQIDELLSQLTELAVSGHS